MRLRVSRLSSKSGRGSSKAKRKHTARKTHARVVWLRLCDVESRALSLRDGRLSDSGSYDCHEDFTAHELRSPVVVMHTHRNVPKRAGVHPPRLQVAGANQERAPAGSFSPGWTTP